MNGENEKATGTTDDSRSQGRLVRNDMVASTNGVLLWALLKWLWALLKWLWALHQGTVRNFYFHHKENSCDNNTTLIEENGTIHSLLSAHIGKFSKRPSTPPWLRPQPVSSSSWQGTTKPFSPERWCFASRCDKSGVLNFHKSILLRVVRLFS